MGPRNLSRGNLIMYYHACQVYNDFNGAAEFKPRKFCGEVPCHITICLYFNGAAEFKPRKCSDMSRTTITSLYTSMGPRNLSRGNGDIWVDGADVSSDFNGAAEFKPRKSKKTRHLQKQTWNFNGAAEFKPRKSDNRLKGREYTEHTSMGPRNLSRGNKVR